MRKIYSVLGAAAIAMMTVSCNSLTGSLTGTKMDTPESTQLVVDALKKNIKTDEWKVYSVRWMEGEELSNDLLFVTVGMVNKNDDAFTQSFYLTGSTAGNVSDLSKATGLKAPTFEGTKGIDFDKIDVAAITKQFEEAKKQMPEGYVFESFSDYEIEEEVPTGNSALDRGKNFGEQKTSFTLNMTEEGKKYVESAGKQSIQYYSMDFEVQPDGTVLFEE